MDECGKIVNLIGNHDESCFLKQESSRLALGYVNENEKENSLINLTQKMLDRAESLALENLSMQPKKIALQVLQETEMNHQIFKSASNCKIVNRMKNSRTKSQR